MTNHHHPFTLQRSQQTNTVKKDKYKGKDRKKYIPEEDIHGRPDKRKERRKEHHIKDALSHIDIDHLDDLDDMDWND